MDSDTRFFRLITNRRFQDAATLATTEIFRWSIDPRNTIQITLWRRRLQKATDMAAEEDRVLALEEPNHEQ